MSHPNAETIATFYSCFQRLDSEGMVACYAEDVRFSDPVFPKLVGPEAGDMWRMLCAKAQGFELSYGEIKADDAAGTARWEAHYDFSATGRRVHNRISASFEFRDGRIVRHDDQFDFWRWSSMALGPVGRLLGWTPLIRNKVRAQAAANLKQFQARSN